MILGLLNDAIVRAALEGAGRWDEDVLIRPADVARALRTGSPRALVVDAAHRRGSSAGEARSMGVPVIEVRAAEVRRWEVLRRERIPPPGRRRFYGAQIEALLPDTPPDWVDRTFGELSRGSGRRLPRALRALGRRVLEDPARYVSLDDLEGLTGLSGDALRARFRRRELPSPIEYVRWFRLLAVVHGLVASSGSVAAVAQATGFQSASNLARFTRRLVGRSPAGLRSPDAETRARLLFVGRCLERDRLDRWRELDDAFQRVLPDLPSEVERQWRA